MWDSNPRPQKPMACRRRHYLLRYLWGISPFDHLEKVATNSSPKLSLIAFEQKGEGKKRMGGRGGGYELELRHGWLEIYFSNEVISAGW